MEWVQEGGYEDWQIGTGFAIGIVSAALCFGCLLSIGVCKQVFNRIRMRVSNPFLKEVLPPLIGGVCIGK